MRLFVLSLVSAVLAGCATQRASGVPLVRSGDVRIVTDDGPWKPVAAEEEIGGPWRVANGGFERPLEPIGPAPEPPPTRMPDRARPAVVAPQAPAGPKLAIPKRRAKREARPVGQKARKSAALLARDHFLDYPTRIVAQRITLHVPPDLAARVRRKGTTRLTLGELTLEGERVRLRTRKDGRNDVQIMARGNVRFVAEVRGNILREEGLRGLLITNDQVAPLR